VNYVSFDTGLKYDFGYNNLTTTTESTFMCVYAVLNFQFSIRSEGVPILDYNNTCGINHFILGCNHYRIEVLPINWRQPEYSINIYGCYDYQYYSYETNIPMINPLRIEVKNSDVLKELNFELTLDTTHPRINDALPHPKTYGYIPINARFVDNKIYDDALKFFADRFKLLIKDPVTGNIYSVWYDSIYQKITTQLETGDDFYTPVHDFIYTTDEHNIIYKIEIKSGIMSARNATNEIGFNHKVVPQFNIIPDVSNQTEYRLITSYRLYYSDSQGFYIKPFKYDSDPNALMDIRAYSDYDNNYEELTSVQLVHQIIKFNEFYNEYLTKIFVNFKRRYSHGQYPLFEVYDEKIILKNIQVSKDTLNQQDPEQTYLYIVTSDFKILSKTKIINGIDVIIEKIPDNITYAEDKIRYRITVGDLGLFDVKYIDGSNYADVFTSREYYKDSKLYFFFAPDNMVSSKYDFLYNYRFISFEYIDRRKFDISKMYDPTDLKQPIIEIRDPIKIKGIKTLGKTITQLFQDFRAVLYPKIDPKKPPVVETDIYQHGCVGIKTRCGKYYTYLIFTNPAKTGDPDYIIIKTYEEEFDDYILAQLRDNINLRERIRTYIVDFDFIKSLICKYQLFCDDVQLICWNRMLDVPTAEQANIIVEETFEDKYQGELNLRYIVDTETTSEYITRVNFKSEYTLGEHNNFVLNHQNLSNTVINSRYAETVKDGVLQIDNVVIEPDLLVIDRDTFEEYRPFSLGLRCPDDYNITDTRFALVPTYRLNDGTLHAIYKPENFSVGCYKHPYILKFSVPLRVKLWSEYSNYQQFENLNSSSNEDIVKEYKSIEAKNMLNIAEPQHNHKLIDYIGISMKFAKNISELTSKNEEDQLSYKYIDQSSFKTYTIYPNRKIDGKARWYISHRLIPYDEGYRILEYIGLKYIIIEYTNFIYMPSRNEILVEDTNSFINLDSISFDPLRMNPIRYEYLTNITYANFEFIDTTSYLVTSHMNEITARKSYNKIQTSKYLYDLKHYQPVATYQNKFINTTIAKRF